MYHVSQNFNNFFKIFIIIELDYIISEKKKNVNPVQTSYVKIKFFNKNKHFIELLHHILHVI